MSTRCPLDKNFSQSQTAMLRKTPTTEELEFKKDNSEMFPLTIAISNKDHEMLSYIWTHCRHLWDVQHL